MNRYITLILALLLTVSMQAQKRISRKYNNVSLSDALNQLAEQQTGYTIYFLYNELEDFRITTTVKNKHLPEAIQQMIGFYPIRVTTSTDDDGRKIFVECIQKTETRYKGSIIDETGQPVAYANVYLLHPSDSTLISGGVSNEAGLFVIPCETNPVLARISFVGYKTVYKLCRNTELGTIRIQPETQTLKGVTVKGERPLFRMNDDAFVTLVEGSFLSKIGTGNDVLAHVPGVIRNGNSIEVIGRGTPLIYINGRQMRNQNELDQLSSDQIKDVEVVMMPGAKYDATVKAVIRIKTIRPVGEGFSFNSRTVAGVNHYVYGLEELNLNYRTGGLDIFGMAEYENRREKYRNSTVQDTWLDSHYEQQSAIGYHTKYKPLEGKVGFNYMLGDNSSLGVTYTVSSQNTHECNEGETTLSVESALVERTVSEGSEDVDGTRHLVNAYYSGNLGKWSMDANADMLLQRLNTHAVTSEQASTDGHRDVTTDNGVRNRLYAVKVVAAHPLWKGEVELGTEGSYIRRTDLFNNVEGIISAGDTKIEENSTAAFVQLTQRLNKLTLMAGLRYEYLDSRYYESGVKMGDESRTYSDLFPSLMLMYPLKNVRARLSYSRNINRPAFDQLSGNVVYINRYTYESGNPYLKPSYRDNLSLALNYKWLTGMIDYARVHDYIITSYSSYQDDPTIALLRKDNVSGFDNLSLMVSAAPTFGKYHPQLMVATQMQNLEVQYRGETKKMNSPMAIVRFNNAVNLPFDSWLNADFSWRSAGDAENMRLASSWQFDISLYKAFWNDRLSVKLACTDLFSSIRQNVTIYNDVRQMYLHKHLDTRNLELTVRYNFNPAKSKYRGQGAGNDVKSRF
ncbi:TonB-dependent receptor [Segatella bryantii]|uniref:TonB-dependent receptor domain-containing protein n=1 Tax=Segatella bryantii TaxID=77095 RepID=UPI001EDBBD92|nr:TonB-dependent receptor [Segatella bryantii]UKK74583.1 TonB-dependent receptor [Segatella bryantii]